MAKGLNNWTQPQQVAYKVRSKRGNGVIAKDPSGFWDMTHAYYRR